MNVVDYPSASWEGGMGAGADRRTVVLGALELLCLSLSSFCSMDAGFETAPDGASPQEGSPRQV